MRTKPILFHGTLFALSLGAALSLSACKKKGCTPASCQAEGTNCGQIVDSCGNIADCGACGVAGETCGGLGPNLCGAGTCDPVTCVEASLDCGFLEDGCGLVRDCGPCDGKVDGDGTIVGTGGSSSGGGAGTGGAAATGGAVGTGGTTPATGGSSNGISPLGSGVMLGEGQSTMAFAEGSVTRDSQWYYFITNGWGSNEGTYTSSDISWKGTSFKVSMYGNPGGSGVPAGYPAAFCGNYADKVGMTNCGLPIAIASATSVKTGWRWKSNGSSGDYNAAWDIWLGDGTNLQSYLMVWLRDPPGQSPANNNTGVTAMIGGHNFQVWTGSVGGRPIVNFVSPQGTDIPELEFDVLEVYNKAVELKNAGSISTSLPGTHINSVAVGFEVWNAATNVESVDFYVDPK